MSCIATSSQRYLVYRSATVSNDLCIVIVVRLNPTTEQKQVTDLYLYTGDEPEVGRKEGNKNEVCEKLKRKWGPTESSSKNSQKDREDGSHRN